MAHRTKKKHSTKREEKNAAYEGCSMKGIAFNIEGHLKGPFIQAVAVIEFAHSCFPWFCLQITPPGEVLKFEFRGC
jgi:hypothetical protein